MRKDATDKLIGIEILRFISALSVLVWHYQFFSQIPLSSPYVTSEQPLYALLWPFYELGHYGVQVFWCVSGFIFFWKYNDAINQGRISASRFLALRFSRLYPLHAATLLYVALMQLLYLHINDGYFIVQNNDAYHFTLQLFMASNWGLEKGYSFNGPIWSISVEVLVYGAFFASSRWLGVGLTRTGCIALIAGLIIITRLSLHPVIQCLLFFYAGGAMARLALQAVDDDARRKRQRLLITTWLLTTMAAAATLQAMNIFQLKPIHGILIWTPPLTLLLGGLSLSAAWTRPLTLAGNITYSSYLLNFPIALTVGLIYSASGLAVPSSSPLFLLAYLGGIMLAAHYCYEHFERPMQDKLRQLLPSHTGFTAFSENKRTTSQHEEIKIQ